MSGQAYVGATQRTFRNALIYEWETLYGLIGSTRVLSLMAEDVERLVREFFPIPQHMSSGWMVYTGVKAKGPKAAPGQRASARESVTLAWPVLLPEDIQYLASHGDNVRARHEVCQRRLMRLLEYGYTHPDGPVLLTEADLAAMLGSDTPSICNQLKEARATSGKPLLTVGYYFDQGMRPTHKRQVITLYESGVDEATIARETNHAPSSVGHYIRDYERVRLLLKQAFPIDQIINLTGLQPNVVKSCVEFAVQFHPELQQTPKT